MKKILIVFIVALMAVLGTTQAQAYSLNLIDNGNVAMGSATSIAFNVVFTPDSGGNLLGNYGFNLLFDTTELPVWDVAGSTYTAPAGLNAQMFGDPFMSTVDAYTTKINSIHANLPFGGSPVLVTAATTLATIQFTSTTQDAVFDGSPDVWFDVGTTGTNFNIDGSVIEIADMGGLNVPDVAVAPEPISSTLFIIGGATLGFRRFTRRKK